MILYCGEMAEWLKAAVCKIVLEKVRRFESYSLQFYSFVDIMKRLDFILWIGISFVVVVFIIWIYYAINYYPGYPYSFANMN